MEQNSNHEGWTSLLIPVALIVGLALLLSINLGPSAPENATVLPIENLLRNLVGYLAAVAEVSAAVVIGFAILQGILSFFKLLLHQPNRHIDASENIRWRLGRLLALGLEFTVASDILRTAVAPTRQDILNLGAIVILRTLLNYFLEREIRVGEEHRNEDEVQNFAGSQKVSKAADAD